MKFSHCEIVLGTEDVMYFNVMMDFVDISVGFYIDCFPVIMRRKQTLWIKQKPFVIYWLFYKEEIVEIPLLSGITLNLFYILFSVEN